MKCTTAASKPHHREKQVQGTTTETETGRQLK